MTEEEGRKELSEIEKFLRGKRKLGKLSASEWVEMHVDRIFELGKGQWINPEAKEYILSIWGKANQPDVIFDEDF